MDEEVSSLVPLDESEALHLVEPLYSALCHKVTSPHIYYFILTRGTDGFNSLLKVDIVVQPDVLAARKRCRGDESRQQYHVAQFNEFDGRPTAQPDALHLL